MFYTLLRQARSRHACPRSICPHCTPILHTIVSCMPTLCSPTSCTSTSCTPTSCTSTPSVVCFMSGLTPTRQLVPQDQKGLKGDSGARFFRSRFFHHKYPPGPLIHVLEFFQIYFHTHGVIELKFDSLLHHAAKSQILPLHGAAESQISPLHLTERSQVSDLCRNVPSE
jgi:hypothetical protein